MPSRARRPVSLALLLALWAHAANARAQDARDGATTPLPSPREAGRSWHASVGVGTDFPLAVGGRVVIEAPYRLRLSTSLGYLPGPYVDAINSAVVAAGGYDDDTARLVKSALERSLVWRTHVGVRAWRGLYLEAGYGLVTLGGATTGSSILALVTDTPLPATEGEDRPFQVDATLHMADVELGYDFHLGPRWRLRTALGGAFAFSTDARIRADYPPLAPSLVAAFSARAADELERELRSYGNTPVVSVSLAYAFF